MEILSSIGGWVAQYIPVVAKVVKKAAEVVYKGADYIEKLIQGKRILTDIDGETYDDAPQKGRSSRPDVISDYEPEKDSMFSDLATRIDESRKKLTTVDDRNQSDHKRIKLQIDMMELIISAQTVDRFTNNINLHAANLQIHLHTIQNTAGLLNDVNRQRKAVKAIMKTVNHLINVTGNKGVVDVIDGIDVNMRPGAISIYGAYEAFENTRDLLLKETQSYSKALDGQMGLIENIRIAARRNPAQMNKINTWIEESIEPSLLAAKENTQSLLGDLVVIPKLESNLKRELKTIQNEEQDN